MGRPTAILVTVGSAAQGFDYVVTGDGRVRIFHHGRLATTLRGMRAQAFVVDVGTEDPQLLMARLTGNYRRGNERVARQHRRNRGP